MNNNIKSPIVNDKVNEMISKNTDESSGIKEEHLLYLKKAVDYLKTRDESGYLLLQEKFLLLNADFMSSDVSKSISFDLCTEVTHYLERMNKKSVEAFNTNNLEEATKVISRIVDFLNQKNVIKLFGSQFKLDEARILTYNNLSCIYRKVGKLSLALKSVSLAINLEEKLVLEQFGSSGISIISTFLNKSAILSEMKRHDKSIEAALKGLEYLNKAESFPNLVENEKNHMKQLHMLSHYNLGVEHEHLEEREKAISSYEKAISYANEIGKTDIKNKIEKALNNLKSH